MKTHPSPEKLLYREAKEQSLNLRELPQYSLSCSIHHFCIKHSDKHIFILNIRDGTGSAVF